MHDPLNGHIFGDSERLFLNTELGCASSCSYCYLPIENYPIGSRTLSRISAAQLLAAIEANAQIRRGRSGTLFSIGCFSECWDSRNWRETISLISGLLPLGNNIQVATKRKISSHALAPLASLTGFKAQVHFYISSSTITQWRHYEKGTTPVLKRFESFSVCKEFGISVHLYIKPVLPNITIQDAEKYGDIMRSYGVSAIVGEQFESNDMGSLAPISKKLVISEHADVQQLRDILSQYGEVFCNSTDTFVIGESASAC